MWPRQEHSESSYGILFVSDKVFRATYTDCYRFDNALLNAVLPKSLRKAIFTLTGPSEYKRVPRRVRSMSNACRRFRFAKPTGTTHALVVFAVTVT